jgi:hypothetical protein
MINVVTDPVMLPIRTEHRDLSEGDHKGSDHYGPSVVNPFEGPYPGNRGQWGGAFNPHESSRESSRVVRWMTFEARTFASETIVKTSLLH